MSSSIDLTTFTSLKESVGEDFIGELISAYFEETPKLISSLKKALEEQNLETFTRSAHSIKSTSNSFGAVNLGTLARELEMMGREGSLAGATEKLEPLLSAYEDVRLSLEELIHGE